MLELGKVLGPPPKLFPFDDDAPSPHLFDPFKRVLHCVLPKA